MPFSKEETRTARSKGDPEYTIKTVLMEWEQKTTEAEKAAIRQSYMSDTNISGVPHYLISWFGCVNNPNKEVWTIKHCEDCQPFHDPGDDPHIRSSGGGSICL